jgi:hypothetical protein
VKGAYAVFAVTNFWESQSAEVEKKQGIAIADAAKVMVSMYAFEDPGSNFFDL